MKPPRAQEIPEEVVKRLLDEGDEWERMKGAADQLGGEHFRYPAGKLVQFTVSGSIGNPRRETKAGVEGDSVLGIDLVRLDPKDAAGGGLYNIDHYFVMRDGNGRYVRYGPIKTADHWVSEIPEKFVECEALTKKT